MLGGFLFGVGTLLVFTWVASGSKHSDGGNQVVAIAFAALLLAFLFKG